LSIIFSGEVELSAVYTANKIIYLLEGGLYILSIMTVNVPNFKSMPVVKDIVIISAVEDDVSGEDEIVKAVTAAVVYIKIINKKISIILQRYMKQLWLGLCL
jgi:hypothetical protein